MRAIFVDKDKKCSKCGEVKLLVGFDKDTSLKCGYSSNCKACKAKGRRKFYGANPGRESARQKRRREANPENFMLSAAKSRARLYALPLNIQISDIVIPKTCPILGIPLFMGTGKQSDNSPSLDRLIPELGYVKGNIMVMSHLANVMKNSATWEQCVLLGEFAKRQIELRLPIRLVA